MWLLLLGIIGGRSGCDHHFRWRSRKAPDLTKVWPGRQSPEASSGDGRTHGGGTGGDIILGVGELLVVVIVVGA